MATKNYYLVDTENVGSTWKDLLPAKTQDDQILLFYTENSPYMSYTDLQMILQYPNQFELIRCNPGKNGLDFQLVSYLGYLLCGSPESRFVIISNDNGFDAVVKFWTDKGMSILRGNTFHILHPGEVEMQPDHHEVNIRSGRYSRRRRLGHGYRSSSYSETDRPAGTSVAATAEYPAAPVSMTISQTTPAFEPSNVSTVNAAFTADPVDNTAEPEMAAHTETDIVSESTFTMMVKDNSLKAWDPALASAISEPATGNFAANTTESAAESATGSVDEPVTGPAVKKRRTRTASRKTTKAEETEAFVTEPKTEATDPEENPDTSKPAARAKKSSSSRAKTGKNKKTETTPETAAKAEADMNTEPETAVKTDSKAEPETKEEVNTKTKPEAAARAALEATGDADTKAEPEAAAETGTKRKSGKTAPAKDSSKAAGKTGRTKTTAKSTEKTKTTKKAAANAASQTDDENETNVEGKAETSVTEEPSYEKQATKPARGRRKKATPEFAGATITEKAAIVRRYLPASFLDEPDSMDIVTDIVFGHDTTNHHQLHLAFVKSFGDERGTVLYKAFRPHLAEVRALAAK